MRIENLTLNNFRSHESTELQLDRLNFIVGTNAAGKSSIAMAIEWLLTGICAVTDEGGKGAEDLIRKGAIAGSASASMVHFAQSFRVGREKSGSGSQLGVNLAGKKTSEFIGPMAKEWMQKNLPPAQVLSAVLNSGRFLDLDPKDQKKLLSQVLADDGIPVPEDIVIPSGEKVVTIVQLDALYKNAFTRRTDVNRELKQLSNLQPPQTIEAPSVESVQEKLRILRQELLQAERNKATIDSDRRNHTQRKSQLETSLAAAKAKLLPEKFLARYKSTVSLKTRANELKEIRSRLSADLDLTRRTGNPENLLNEKALRDAEKEAKNGPRLAELTAEENQLRAQISAKDEAIAAISQIKGSECPTCQRGLSGKERLHTIDRLKAEKQVVVDKLEAIASQIEACGDPEDAAKFISLHRAAVGASEKIASLENELKHNGEQIEACGDVDEAQAKISEHLQGAKEVERCEKELAALGEFDGAGTEDLEETIQSLNERVQKGESVLAQVSALQSQIKRYNDQVARQAQLQDEFAQIEKVLAFSGPDGARKKATEGKIGAFTESIAKALAPFGFRCAIKLEPFDMHVATDGTNGKSIHQLSESERFRFSVAFQIALAQVTGIGLVVIDRADVLDRDARRQLTKMLFDSGIEQAIVCSTTSDPLPPSVPEGVKFFQLSQENNVTRVVAEAPEKAVAA
jgi:DNA repair exonuclease SbcCD ATPase subunit